MWLRLLVVLLLPGALLAGCAEPVGPESAIRANITAMEAALTDHSKGDFLEHLADPFAGGHAGRSDLDREAAGNMLTAYFFRYRHIDVVVSQVNVEINPYDPAFAESTANVALVGRERLLPESARLYQVIGQWQNFDDEWKLIRLEWE